MFVCVCVCVCVCVSFWGQGKLKWCWSQGVQLTIVHPSDQMSVCIKAVAAGITKEETGAGNITKVTSWDMVSGRKRKMKKRVAIPDGTEVLSHQT